MFRAGDRIGSYVLKERIGKGAFGIVWLAEETTLLTSHKFALKLPNEEYVDLEAIRQEASLWEQVKGHPNVLPIIKADIADGQIYIASEYAPDGSLADWLKSHRGRAPSITAAVEITKGILAGLGHLHSKQVIHRDLKPENILLQGETPRIADFGIARALKESHSLQVAGTPNYMAPEGFKGVRSVQTDIWAAGVIFYQLVTGRLLFPQSDLMSLMNAVVNDGPQIDAQRVPPQLLPIINKALEKDTAKRYQSVAAMRDDLRKVRLDDLEEAIATVTIDDTQRPTDKSGPQSVTNPADKQDTDSLKAAPTASFFKNKMFRWSGAALAAAVLVVGAAYTGINYSRNSDRDPATPPETPTADANLKSGPSKDSIDNVSKWAQWAELLERDEYDKLVGETTEDIARDPANPIAYRMRATAYYSLEKEDAARGDIREVLRLTDNPQTAEQYEARCYALKRLNKLDEGLKTCTTAIQLDPDLSLAYNVRGTIYHQKQMYDLAVKDYNEAIMRSPKASFYMNRAITLEEMGKKELAETDKRRAKNLNRSKKAVPEAAGKDQPRPTPLIAMPKPTSVPSMIKPVPKPTKGCSEEKRVLGEC